MALRERPINRQLQAYEEGWKKDHEAAMRCRDFEEALAVGVAIFHALVQIDLAYRQRVARGLEAFSPEEDEALRGCYRWWLRPCAEVMKRLRHYEDKFGAVEGDANFRRCCEEAQEIVAEWRPASPGRVAAQPHEPVVAHTAQALTAAELSQALDRVSRPTEQESVPLRCNPDDYPLF